MPNTIHRLKIAIGAHLRSAINHDWTRNFLVIVGNRKTCDCIALRAGEMLGYRAFDRTAVKLEQDFDKINLYKSVIEKNEKNSSRRLDVDVSKVKLCFNLIPELPALLRYRYIADIHRSIICDLY